MRQTSNNSHLGHRNRLHQKMAEAGADTFLEHEILDLLLTYAIPRKDTKPLAWTLLKRFGSLNNVLDAEETALLETPGIGPHTAQLIKLVRNLLKRYTLAQVKKNIQIRTPQQVLNYCRASLADKKEEFLELLFLSVRNTLISTRIISAGEINQVSASPRKVVEWALKEKASALILVHNHPSGDASPSEEDLQLTQAIAQAARFFDIHIQDHIIIAKGMYYSFKAEGFL